MPICGRRCKDVQRAVQSQSAGETDSRPDGHMWEAVALLMIVGAALLWADSLKARERAVKAGRSACERYQLQFLDETVSFTRMRLARDEDGQLRIKRTYTFEFSDTGNNRRHGAIVMLGGEVADMHLEPYRMQ